MILNIKTQNDLDKLGVELYNRGLLLRFNNGHVMYRKFIQNPPAMFELRGYFPGDVWAINFDTFEAWPNVESSKTNEVRRVHSLEDIDKFILEMNPPS